MKVQEKSKGPRAPQRVPRKSVLRGFSREALEEMSRNGSFAASDELARRKAKRTRKSEKTA